MPPLTVFAYNDFRRYLADWFSSASQPDASLTKSEMSRRLGLPNTRSYFTDVLAGKKVTPTFVDRFIAVLGLDREEGSFFRVLVRFNQAETPEERELAFDQLVSLNRTPQSVVDPRAYRYYRHWWNGAVRALLSVGDFSDDPEVIARRLVPQITVRQAREALELLAELDLIERDERGFWKPAGKTLTTGDNSQAELVRQLQMQQFDLARSAVMTDYALEKEIATNTISISAEGLRRIRKRIARFRSEVRSLIHKDADPADRVYQLVLALFPLMK